MFDIVVANVFAMSLLLVIIVSSVFRCCILVEEFLPLILFIIFHTLFIGVLLFSFETKYFQDDLLFCFIVRRAFARAIRKALKFIVVGNRRNTFSDFFRRFITVLHSSSNHGFLRFEIVEVLGIVFSDISIREFVNF